MVGEKKEKKERKKEKKKGRKKRKRKKLLADNEIRTRDPLAGRKAKIPLLASSIYVVLYFRLLFIGTASSVPDLCRDYPRVLATQRVLIFNLRRFLDDVPRDRPS